MTNQINQEAFNTWKQNRDKNDDVIFPVEIWQAATKSSESEINSLKQRVEELKFDVESFMRINKALVEESQHYLSQINLVKADNIRMREALKHADEFITNGIEFGFIRMPDDDLKGIDSAHDTPEIVRKTLSSTPTQSLAEHDTAARRQREADVAFLNKEGRKLPAVCQQKAVATVINLLKEQELVK